MGHIRKLLYVVAALCMGTAAVAQDSGWSISEADGQVSVIRGERTIYGARGTVLQTGDIIKTSKAANAVLVRGDDFYVIASGKMVRIKPAQEQGVVSQAFEFVGDLFTSGRDNRLRDGRMAAAVVKGYAGGTGSSYAGGSADAERASDEESSGEETSDD